MSLFAVLLAIPLAPVIIGVDMYKMHVKHDDSSHIYSELVIPTRMKDKDLIDEAIKKYSQTLPESEKYLFTNKTIPLLDKSHSIAKMKFRFNKELGTFEVVANNVTRSQATKHVEKIFDIYTGLVQQKVCERVKAKLKETEEMTLDNEEILEDDTVVLTVGVNG